MSTEPSPIVDATCDCEACISRTTETYDVGGWCLNCGHAFTVRCRKGDRRPLSVECPFCEVPAFSWALP